MRFRKFLTIFLTSMVMSGIVLFGVLKIYDTGYKTGLAFYRQPLQRFSHSYYGCRVTLFYSEAENVITAVCKQTYDVPENITSEHIRNLLHFIEKTNNADYVSWLGTGGKIVKRRPTYTIEINGHPREIDYEIPAIDIDSEGRPLFGGHNVIVDANGLLIDWAEDESVSWQDVSVIWWNQGERWPVIPQNPDAQPLNEQERSRILKLCDEIREEFELWPQETLYGEPKPLKVKLQ